MHQISMFSAEAAEIHGFDFECLEAWGPNRVNQKFPNIKIYGLPVVILEYPVDLFKVDSSFVNSQAGVQ